MRRVSTELLNARAAALLDASAPVAETLARIIGLARRAHGLGQARAALGPLTLDLIKRRASVDGVVMLLRSNLYELLEHMVMRSGELIAHGALLDHLYGLSDAPDGQILHVNVSTLRTRLAQADCSGIEIRGVRGSGVRGSGFRLCLARYVDRRTAVVPLAALPHWRRRRATDRHAA